jgi:hypothetical protein
MSTEIQLAPAAGAGIGKEIAANLLARAGFIDKMADALDNALTATRRTWDAGSKSWIEEPDTRSQLQAFFGCLAHMEGEPIKRIIHQHTGTGKAVDPLEALRESPALREATRRALDKAEWRQSGRNGKAPKQADAADIEV